MSITNSEFDCEEKKELLYRSLKENPLSVSYEFQEFVDFGSKKSNVTPFDITVYEPEKKREDRKYTAEELMQYGAKLMDANMFQHITNKERFGFVQSRQKSSINHPTEIGEALFCVFYCLLTKGEVPPQVPKIQEKIPKFVHDIMKNPASFETYSKMIASFDINLMDRIWIKKIKLYGIPLKIKHRLTFGVLGHDTLDIFRLFKPENIEYSDYCDSYYAVLEFASKGPSWDVFPLTSKCDKRKRFENLELIMKALIHEIYTDTQVKQMKEHGLSPGHDFPQDLRVLEYQEFNEFNDFIFTEEVLDKPVDNVLFSKSTYPLYFYGTLEEELTKEKASERTKSFISFDPITTHQNNRFDQYGIHDPNGHYGRYGQPLSRYN
ncbi:unnamed protein product [Rhizopus stolonifer]